MIRQTIYIGPVKIILTAEESMGALLCDKMFEHPVGVIKACYFAEARFVSGICPIGKVLYEGNGTEVRSVPDSSAEHRYSYWEIDWERQYFSHYSLRGDQIRMELSRGTSFFGGEPFEIWRFMFLEQLLLKHGALILHSSSVIWKQKAILFSAPSGTGKSTQADLWKDTIPDCIGLNGDRNLLYRQDGHWVVAGLPWHGTSADCRNVQCPVAAIVYIKRSASDFVQSLSPVEQVTLLYSEITVNRWKADHVARVFALLEDLSQTVPVAALNCTPLPSAVLCMKSFLEGLDHGTL